MNRDKELQKAVLAVMLGQKKEPVEEAKKPLHPNQQKIDVHEPEKDELTAKDFEMLRAGKKAKDVKEEKIETVIEADSSKGKVIHTDTGTATVSPTHVHFDNSGYKESFSHEEINRMDSGKKVRGFRRDKENDYADERTHVYTNDDEDHHLPSNWHKKIPKPAQNEEVNETRFKKGQDVGKPGMNFAKIAKTAAAKYGSKEAGQRVAGAVLKKVLAKEEIELDDEAEETVFVHTPLEIEIKENYNFGDYLTAAKRLVSEEEAIHLANEKFRAQDVSIFAEEFMRSDIEDKIKVHQKAGHKVSMPKYSTKSGKPYAEYIVTDKESGVRRKYIHHGSMRSVQNMGAAGKKDEE